MNPSESEAKLVVRANFRLAGDHAASGEAQPAASGLDFAPEDCGVQLPVAELSSSTALAPSPAVCVSLTRRLLEAYLDDPMAEWVEKHSKLAISAVLLFMLLVGVGVACNKVFWYDELVTVLTATLPTWGEVWRFFADGLDTTSPVASLMARAGSRLPLPPELSIRLPFILAFLCMCLGIYGFLRRRYSAGYAMAGLLFPLVLPGLSYYMTESRAYACMLAGAGLGMYFWQSAAEGKARPFSIAMLWLVLASAVAAHLFAVFLFVPFAAAQLFLDLSRKRPDWPMWLALVLFPAGHLPFLKGTLNASRIYRAGFHARADFGSFRTSYREIYLSGGWIVVSVLLLLALWLILESGKQSDTPGPQITQTTGLSKAEWIFAGLLTLSPVYIALASFKIGVFRQQYVLCFYIGFIVLTLASFAELVRRRAGAGVLALIVILVPALAKNAGSALGGIKALSHLSKMHQALAAQVMARPWLQRLSDTSLPIALDANSYMDVTYYGPAQLRRHVYALNDEADFGNPKYRESITNQQNVKFFSRMLAVHATEVGEFLRQHPHFLVLTHFDPHEWLPDYLLRREAQGELSVEVRSVDQSNFILEVQKK